MIGLLPAWTYEQGSVTLQPGDLFVSFTDGISEAMNADADLFGDSRLSRIVEEHGHLESSELRERILREIEAFVAAITGGLTSTGCTAVTIRFTPAALTFSRACDGRGRPASAM